MKFKKKENKITIYKQVEPVNYSTTGSPLIIYHYPIGTVEKPNTFIDATANVMAIIDEEIGEVDDDTYYDETNKYFVE